MVNKKYKNIFFISLSLLVIAVLYFKWDSIFLHGNPFHDLEAQTTSIDWPQFQHDPQHTGRSTSSVSPSYEVAWAWADKNHIVRNFVSAAGKNITDGFESGYTFNVIFAEQIQPIVASGSTYFGGMNGILYAVDALTGANKWDYASGGPILSTAAYANGVLVFTSMDGSIYGINASNGSKTWSYKTNAGINASPIISGNNVYVGSRDGVFYALDLVTGNLKWKYTTRVEPASANSPLNKAPIAMTAVLSEDSSTVFFGAENMFFYALNTSNGSEKWSPKKLVGQSFLYGWPVVKGNVVVVRTMSSLVGAERGIIQPDIEPVLDSLSADPSWPEEKSAILNYLSQNPHQKSMYVFDVATGNEPYQVAMGRVSGQNFTPMPPVIDNQNRLLGYWRTKKSSFVEAGPCFGTKYCPDISAMDIANGDRIKIGPSIANFHPELDNGFGLTIGGDYLYGLNSFRGSRAINLTNGNLTFLSIHSARWDCGGYRSQGFQIVYYGNDSEPNCTYTNARPQSAHTSPIGYGGIVIAQTNGIPMLYVNDPDAGFIVAIRRKP